MWTLQYSGNLAEGVICPVIKDYCSACQQVHSQKFCEVTGAEVKDGQSECPDDPPEDELYE